MVTIERAPSPPASTAACDISAESFQWPTSTPSPHEARFGKTDLLRRLTVLSPIDVPKAEVLTQHALTKRFLTKLYLRPTDAKPNIIIYGIEMNRFLRAIVCQNVDFLGKEKKIGRNVPIPDVRYALESS